MVNRVKKERENNLLHNTMAWTDYTKDSEANLSRRITGMGQFQTQADAGVPDWQLQHRCCIAAVNVVFTNKAKVDAFFWSGKVSVYQGSANITL